MRRGLVDSCPACGLRPDTGQMGTACVGRTGALGRSPRSTAVLSGEQGTRARGREQEDRVSCSLEGGRVSRSVRPRTPCSGAGRAGAQAGLRHRDEEGLGESQPLGWSLLCSCPVVECCLKGKKK